MGNIVLKNMETNTAKSIPIPCTGAVLMDDMTILTFGAAIVASITDKNIYEYNYESRITSWNTGLIDGYPNPSIKPVGLPIHCKWVTK